MAGRDIPQSIKYQILARTAGRCEFPGCNKPLYEDELTKRPGKYSNYAHIIPYEVNGPRGEESKENRPQNIHSLDNLMLLCWEHHKKIDTEVSDYPVEKLQRLKREHEQRISLATSIQAKYKSFIVSYAARIAQRETFISKEDARLALLPHYYPAQNDIIELSPELSSIPQNSEWYQYAVNDLRSRYNDSIQRRLNGCKSAHFSIFAIAPMPLLIQLGVLFNDTSNVKVYQKQRDAGWKWVENAPIRTFSISKPENIDGRLPVLLIMLTQEIDDFLVRQLLGEDVAIWKITSDYHNYDFISNEQHLKDFKRNARQVLDDVLRHYPNGEVLHVFPIMPVSACVEFGRIRTAAHNPWEIYEREFNTKIFVKRISIK